MEPGQPRTLQLDRRAGSALDELQHSDVEALMHLDLEAVAVNGEHDVSRLAPPFAGVEVYTTEVQRRRPLARGLDGGVRAIRRSGRTGHDHGAAGLRPTATGRPHRSNLSGWWVAMPIAVISLPIIAAPLGILLLWRRGRAPRADADTRDRALAPWR